MAVCADAAKEQIYPADVLDCRFVILAFFVQVHCLAIEDMRICRAGLSVRALISMPDSLDIDEREKVGEHEGVV